MSGRIHLGTRKGLFTLNRGSAGWEITNVAFLGETVSMLLSDPRDGTLYAALMLGHFGVKLHRSNDGGTTWTECAVPKFSETHVVPDGFPDGENPVGTKPASLSEIWSLEARGDELWAGTIPAALWRSRDHGDSWELIESLWDREERLKWFGGGKDEAGLHSICVDPRDTDHVTVAISCGGVWETRDAGESWELLGQGLRQEYTPPDLAFDPVTQDAHRLAFSAADPDTMWVQHHNGIFHSSDTGRSFRELTDVAPSTFGFTVCAHPSDANTAWFVPAVKDECRVPVDGRLVVTRTRDGGETFDVIGNGLPQSHCYDIVFRHGLDVDATGNRLAMGSSTGGLWVSEDSGETWSTVSTTLPPIYCVRFDEVSSTAGPAECDDVDAVGALRDVTDADVA